MGYDWVLTAADASFDGVAASGTRADGTAFQVVQSHGQAGQVVITMSNATVAMTAGVSGQVIALGSDNIVDVGA